MAFGAVRAQAAAGERAVTGSLPHSLARAALGLALGGLLAGLAFPQRLSGALAVAALMGVQLSVGSLFFVAIHHATAAVWGVVVRRVGEALAAALPGLALAWVGVLLAFGSHLFPWVHHAEAGFRGWWLSFGFFLVRAVAYLALWVGFSRLLVGGSLVQDGGDGVAWAVRLRRRAVGFLPVFAVTFSLSAFDWLMSQEPEWVSTIFGVYVFAGTLTAALAALTLLVTVLLAHGPRGVGSLAAWVNEHHLHDLGKLLFAFATFWAYIWFSQFMLVWYANLPEEAVYFVKRLLGMWQPLFVANLFLNWVIPFFALLPRSAKKNPRTLRNVAVCLLAGHALDLYLMVGPGQRWEPLPTPVETLLVAGAVLGVLALALRFLSRWPVVPQGDPFLEASRRHHG